MWLGGVQRGVYVSGGGGGGTQIWNWYICATQGLKMGGLGNGSSLKMRAFQSSHSQEKQDFGAKNKKEKYIFLKRGSLRSAQVRKAEQKLYIFEKGPRSKKWNL